MKATLVLIFCLLSVTVARGEFTIKYFIEGHIVTSGPSPETTNGPVDMDGDPSTLEAVVLGGSWGDGQWTQMGVTRLRTGQTEWIHPETGGGYYYPAGGYSNLGFVEFVPPMYADVDGDNIVDGLVIVHHWVEGRTLCWTAVIGWVGGPAAVDQVDADPEASTLRAAQPNPTTGPASIAFSLPGRSRVQLSIFDVSGRRIADLLDGTLAGGGYSIPWDGRDDNGQTVASGTYFYQLTVDDREESKRMVVIR